MTTAFSRDQVEGTLSPFAEASPLPRAAYTDEAIFAFERRAILAPAWQLAAREEDVAEPGSWVRALGSGDRIVLARAEDLRLRGFYDVCRHRGTPLCDGEAGKAHHFACRYHGFTYELTGALRTAPGAFPDLDRAAHALLPVRAETFRGFVFVTEDAGAEPLEGALGTPPPWWTTPLPVRRVQRSRYHVLANWKLVVENFQESHHFPRVHPALERLTPSPRASSWLSDGPWLGGVMELADDAETVSHSGALGGRPLLGSPDPRKVFDAMLFPSLLTSLQPDYLLTYRLEPLSARETRIVADVHFHVDAVSGRCDARDVVDFWARVNEEDRAICERQQVGMERGVWVPTRYCASEDGVHAFDRMVARRYLELFPERP